MDLPENQNNVESKELTDWVADWQAGIFPFHRKEVHNVLVKYMSLLSNQQDKIKVFVPLCGKSVDMKWLYDQGHTVVGVEIASEAIKQFFSEQNVEFTTETMEKFTCYKSGDERIKIYCGDLYDFTSSKDGQFDAIWDKSSLTAVELKDREKYVRCLADLLTQHGMYLIVTPNYDTNVMKGPPRCISEEDIQRIYGGMFNIKKLEEFDGLTERWKSLGHKYFNNTVHLMSFKKAKTIEDRPEIINNVESKELKHWVTEWQAGVFPFHLSKVHSLLIKYMSLLSKQQEKINVFVPLCGKSLDMKWLYDQGHSVVGVEIASEAIIQFFIEQNVEFTTETTEKFTCYKNADGRIKIYCGDMYDFTSSMEGRFDAVWDKSSFNAIELKDREKYSKCLTDLLKQDGMYLITSPKYDTSIMKGPPRNVSDEDLQRYFGGKFDIKKLEEFDSLNERWKSLGHKHFKNAVHLMSFKNNSS